MMTLKPPTLLGLQVRLTYLQRDSPASLSVTPEISSVPKMIGICGPTYSNELLKDDRAGSWARTFAALLLGQTGWFSTKRVLTWKMQVTKSHRFYYQLAASMPRTKDIAYSSSPEELLPTPGASENDQGPKARAGMLAAGSSWKGQNRGATVTTMALAGLLPTPCASEPQTVPKGSTNHGNYFKRPDGSKINSSINLLALHGLLPTPRTSGIVANMNITPALQFRNKSNLEEVISGYLFPQLAVSATSQAAEGFKLTGLENQDSLTKRARSITGETFRLNTRFVAEMMGFPVDHTESPYRRGAGKQ